MLGCGYGNPCFVRDICRMYSGDWWALATSVPRKLPCASSSPIYGGEGGAEATGTYPVSPLNIRILRGHIVLPPAISFCGPPARPYMSGRHLRKANGQARYFPEIFDPSGLTGYFYPPASSVFRFVHICRGVGRGGAMGRHCIPRKYSGAIGV